MFQWDKSVQFIDLPADKVLHLFRSMREVQLALPGVSAQQASSYLCQYQAEGGVATVAVFHLHKSKVLSFYFCEPRIVSENETDSMLDQGLNFVESMGFLMTDQDIHLLDAADKEMLWASLPVKAGLPDEDEASHVEAAAPKVEEDTASKAGEKKVKSAKVKAAGVNTTPVGGKERPATVKSSKTVKQTKPVVTLGAETPSDEPKTEANDNVDDLLAAVEAMRAKRPGLRARKTAPSAEEMESRRLKLRETVGRILASL